MFFLRQGQTAMFAQAFTRVRRLTDDQIQGVIDLLETDSADRAADPGRSEEDLRIDASCDAAHAAVIALLRSMKQGASDPPAPGAPITGLYVVFDGGPGHESGRFVELENERGEGVGPHTVVWTQEPPPSTYWRLGPFAPATEIEQVTVERDAALARIAEMEEERS